MKSIFTLFIKLVILYFSILLIFSFTQYLSNSNYLNEILIKYLFVEKQVATDLLKNIFLFLISIITIIFLSRGHLWMYGINSLNFKQVLNKYLIFFIPYLIILFLIDSNMQKEFGSKLNLNGIYYFNKIIVESIAFVIFYYGLIQSVIEKKIFSEHTNIIYKLNCILLLLILIFSFENYTFQTKSIIYIPLIIANGIIFSFTKSLLIPLIAQIVIAVLILFIN
ncbi:MAG: hypothetical protein O3A55_04330 [Bacteroidetes bacterium]|nr:hypothetical protein [Bacteroidota bacterium]